MKRLSFALLALALLLPVSAWAGNFSTSTCCAVVDYTDANGLIWFSDGTTDLSAYRSGVTGGWELKIIDSSGLVATADVGSAEASGTTNVGSEIVPSPDCSSDFWDTRQAPWTHDALNDEFDIDGTQATYKYLIENPGLTLNAAYVSSISIRNHVAGAIGVSLANGARTTPAYLADGTYMDWGCCTHNTFFYVEANSAADLSVYELSLKRILTPGATGIYVTNWSIDAGFDYNDSSGYTVTIKKADKGKIRSRSRN